MEFLKMGACDNLKVLEVQLYAKISVEKKY